jgi:hypothetical protein
MVAGIRLAALMHQVAASLSPERLGELVKVQIRLDTDGARDASQQLAKPGKPGW